MRHEKGTVNWLATRIPVIVVIRKKGNEGRPKEVTKFPARHVLAAIAGLREDMLHRRHWPKKTPARTKSTKAVFWFTLEPLPNKENEHMHMGSWVWWYSYILTACIVLNIDCIGWIVWIAWYRYRCTACMVNCLCVALWAYVVILFYSQGPDPVYICFSLVLLQALHWTQARWLALQTLVLYMKNHIDIFICMCICIYVFVKEVLY